MLLLFILCAFLQTIAAESCDTNESCLSCAETSGCRWCVETNRCVSNLAALLKCRGEERADEPLKCPVPIKQGYEYSDEFARNKMHPLSIIAYSDDPQTCLNNALKGVQVVYNGTEQCHSIGSQYCSGFTAIYHSKKAIIVSFRGTKGITQLATEGLVTLFTKHLVPLEGAGKVNSYFLNGFNQVWNSGMKDVLQKLIQENPDYELWVTGHSLGGAMASIAATVIVRDKMKAPENVKLVTFGQPRTGDRDYATAHNNMVYYSYRVVKRNDIVPHVPSSNVMHYFHHRNEIWYDNEMKPNDPFQLCTTEGHSCSNARLIRRSVSDHTSYFGKPHSDYRKELCEEL